MKLLIFETNLGSTQNIAAVQSLFNNHHSIIDWHVDMQDVDNVLRIEAKDNMEEVDVINLMATEGFYCGDLVG
jgi:hypothetical protein